MWRDAQAAGQPHSASPTVGGQLALPTQRSPAADDSPVSAEAGGQDAERLLYIPVEGELPVAELSAAENYFARFIILLRFVSEYIHIPLYDTLFYTFLQPFR